MAERIPQNTAIRVPLQAVLSSDNITPATGKTIAIVISKNGAAYANPGAGATNATEIGNGSYYVDLAAGDINTLGPLFVRGTASGTDQVIVEYDVIPVVSVTPPLPTAATPTGTNFLNPIDIANRSCQHCGVDLIDSVLGFTEVSRQAAHISLAYPKLRRAELRRNVWRFATRTAALRPVDTNTVLLSPALWASTTTYFVGSVVADQNGYLWISQIRDNLNNSPGQSGTQSMWQPYFGPLTVQLYDSSTAYFTGELVYTMAGDGTYNTYLSLANANAIHPALPNQWAATTVYFKDNVVQSFPAWSSLTTYTQGQGVVYTDGNIYASLVNSNLNNIPSATAGTKWALVPVLTLQSQQVPVTSANLVAQLTSTPVGEWSQGTTYSLGSVVMFNGNEYVSTAANNTGNFPSVSNWAQITGGTFYQSLIDFNLGNSPASSPSDWTNVFTQGGGNSMWMQIGGASFPTGVGLTTLNIIYPVGTGPSSQTTTRNIYRLPAGYLRKAPQDSKRGSTSIFGAPTGLSYTDWEFQDNFIVSSESYVIVFRFVADMTDVSRMDDMFCEALAASIANAVCQSLTQSNAKLADIRVAYKKTITEAIDVNGIEKGATEPSIDDLITTRY